MYKNHRNNSLVPIHLPLFENTLLKFKKEPFLMFLFLHRQLETNLYKRILRILKQDNKGHFEASQIFFLKILYYDLFP